MAKPKKPTKSKAIPKVDGTKKSPSIPRVKGSIHRRQYEIAHGIPKWSPRALKHRRGVYKMKNLQKKPVIEQPSKKQITLKNGKTVSVISLPKSTDPKVFPSKNSTFVLPSKKKSTPIPTTVKLRKRITPGTVLILLAGSQRGRKVIFLKQLASGLLLVTGPHKMSRVPLRRINQSFVIATSVKIDISSIKIDAKYNDEYFAKQRETKKKSESEFFAEEKDKKKTIAPEKLADQLAFDAPLIAIIKKDTNIEAYLKAPFSLRTNRPVHQMKF